jgi:hypothetical protein
MATNGIVSVIKDGKTLFKCVAGCNGMTAEKLVKALAEVKELTLDNVYKACLDHDFGCKDCTVVQSENDFRAADQEEPLPPLYKEKFSDPQFNPRWDIGIASHKATLDLDNELIVVVE